MSACWKTLLMKILGQRLQALLPTWLPKLTASAVADACRRMQIPQHFIAAKRKVPRLRKSEQPSERKDYVCPYETLAGWIIEINASVKLVHTKYQAQIRSLNLFPPLCSGVGFFCL